MRRAQEQIESEMDKLRGLIADLRPAALDELGLEASVRDLAERTQVVYGIEVDTSLELHDAAGAPRRLAPEVETTAYRIAQECLSNAARHAGASRVVVEVSQRNGALQVRVTDDGARLRPRATRPRASGSAACASGWTCSTACLRIDSQPAGTRGHGAASCRLSAAQVGTSDASTSPRSSAYSTRSDRRERPSLRWMRARWLSTVRTLR